MKLTPDEAQFLRERIALLQKQARRWKFQKVMAIVCLILGLGLLFGADKFAAYMGRIPEEMYAEAFPQDRPVTVQDMRSYVDINILMLRVTFIGYLKALLVAGVGTAMFVWTFSNRKKDRQDLLIAKFLTETLNESEIAP
jgi:uncharacterized membrane protein YczE